MKSSITGHRFPMKVNAAGLDVPLKIYNQSPRFVSYIVPGFAPFDLPFAVLEALEDQQNVTVLSWSLAPADEPGLTPRDYLVQCRKMECVHVSFGVI